MSDTTIYNQYNLRFTSMYDDGEINDDPDMCDPIGYEPFEQQIYDLMNAGENLSAWYEENYPNDYVDPEDSSDSGIMSSQLPYMDQMDLADQLIQVNARIKDQQAQAQQAQASTSTSTPQTASPPPDTGAPSNSQ